MENKDLIFVNQVLKQESILSHAYHVINYDLETICPSEAKEDQADILNYLISEDFKLITDEKFVSAFERLYENRQGLSHLDQLLVEDLHRSYLKRKNITPEFNDLMNKEYSASSIAWHEAKPKSDYEIFKPHLQKVIEIEKEKVTIRNLGAKTTYDELLSDFERGITTVELDSYFDECKKRIIPLLQKIQKSKKHIRNDFMTRNVPIYLQEKFSQYLLEVIGFDYSRGALTTTEHPFTDELARKDVRITTHYFEDNFISNVFSVIHEGGHAIFGQNQFEEDHDHYLADRMSMGMHESVSRFYENRIGRSYEFIKTYIYPNLPKFFPGIFDDVSLEELYQGINEVTPSLIRTEADELTYTLHIIIRYELEKEICNGNIDIDQLPKLWNQKYKDYLGIEPKNDKEGILQDVHWSTGFGYFPTYALGNAYNAMYYNTMNKELDVKKTIESGNLMPIRDWMSQHVFKEANHLDAKTWLENITSRKFTADDFLDYLEEKYSKIYDL